jgi:uncharacterized protein RhaS with RHS repeats
MTPPSGGLTTTVTYDANGNVISVSESSGRVTTYTYELESRHPADGDGRQRHGHHNLYL